MRKITSLLMLMLLAFTGLPTFAQDGGEYTIEYEAYPGWYRNDGASIFWAGFTTPGTEDKTYKMSSFQFAQSAGYGAAERYTAIATAAPTGSGATLSENDVLAVSTNSVLATNANGTSEFYTYNLSDTIELTGATTYYMVFITSNEPDDNGMYTVASQRICLLYNVATYPAQVMSSNGSIPSNWIPGFKATLTMSEEDVAEILLEQLVTEIAFDASNYQVDVPGGYPQQLIDNCQEAYELASDLIGAGASYDEVMEAYNRLKDAYAALLAGLIPVEVTPGYYYLVSARPTPSGAAVVSVDDLDLTSAVGMKINDDGDRLIYGSELNTTLEGTDAEPAFIWKLEAAEDGYFTFNSLLYSNYVDDNGGRNSYYGFTANSAEAGRFAAETSTHVAGMVYFRQVSVDANDGYNSLCVSPSYSAVTNWLQDGVSSWLLVPVSEATVNSLGEKIKDIQEAAAQAARNDTLTKWATLAADARESARSFLFDGTNDGAFPTEESLGLVTKASQLWSNAKDPQEGSYEELFDGVYTTYFHTSWHASVQADEPHYLQMDLGQEVQTLILKYAVRQNAGQRDVPYIVRLYGTNDASKLSTTTSHEEYEEKEDGSGMDTILVVVSDTVPSSEWTDLGVFTMNYPYQLVDAEGNLLTISAAKTNPTTLGAGVCAFELDAPYRYVRLSVEESIQSYVNGSPRTNGDGFSYWCLSELRAYDGAYDTNCIYANMSEEVRTELEQSLAAAAAELAEEKATQATIDRLKDAYNAFMAVYPDMSKLQAAINEAQSWITPAVEGTEIGNYQSGAKDAFQEVVDAAKVVASGTLTYASYSEAMNALENGTAAFAAKMVAPSSGYYNIQSLTTGAAKESYLIARSTSTTDKRANNGLAWDYAGLNTNDYVNALWYVDSLSNGKFTFRNVASGYYMGNTQTNLSGGVPQSAEPCEIALRAARDTMGYGINFVMNEEGTLFGNSDPSAGFVVWNSGKGNDNSAWLFLEANYEGTLTIALNKPVSIHTLPFEVLTPDYAYAVAGITEDGANLALNAISARTLPAGTPFVIIADTASVKNVQAYLMANQAEDIAYVREGLVVDGLVGVLEPDTIDDKGLVMNAKCTELVYAGTAALQSIAPNSGYFVWSALQALPAVSGGDELIPLQEALQTGIENVKVEPVVLSRQGIYTLQGQKVGNARNLPAGVYIINGRKVLVK